MKEAAVAQLVAKVLDFDPANLDSSPAVTCVSYW